MNVIERLKYIGLDPDEAINAEQIHFESLKYGRPNCPKCCIRAHTAPDRYYNSVLIVTAVGQDENGNALVDPGANVTAYFRT